MNKKIFDILLLISRPAAGKSEIIDHLKQTELSERIQRYHIGQFEEIDDFPMIWAWFEEDTILTRLGYPRLHTDENNYFIGQHLWNLLIKRICLEYSKKIAENPNFHDKKTAIIEFARGSEHGGFTDAFKYLDINIVKKMAVMYVDVSWKESLRKNRARFNPARPHSILEHALPDEKLETQYRFVDWESVSAPNQNFLTIKGIQVPYIVFENEDDITTARGALLSSRLETRMGKLWELSHPYQLEVEND